jgi:ABC-type multidrug transport system ATPase subunit
VQVPEGRQVLATLTIEENLQMGAWHTGGTAQQSIDAVYDRFPVLAERRALPAGSLSGGEQQMLAIARALVAAPTVVLMDEPSMGLAPKVVDEVFRVIEEIRASGTTVVLVEQNARRALRAADHGYVLQSGEVVHSGPAAGLLADERIVQAYLGGREPARPGPVQRLAVSLRTVRRTGGPVPGPAPSPDGPLAGSRREPASGGGKRVLREKDGRPRPGLAVSLRTVRRTGSF